MQNIEIDGVPIRLRLIESISAPAHDARRILSYAGTDVALACYSCSVPGSYEYLMLLWNNEAQFYVHAPVIRVCTKADLKKEGEATGVFNEVGIPDSYRKREEKYSIEAEMIREISCLDKDAVKSLFVDAVRIGLLNRRRMEAAESNSKKCSVM